jgi:capsular exopolysaccharide synthesis family protein
MSSKSNAYANRFSKALGFEFEPKRCEKTNAAQQANIVPFPEGKIGAPENQLSDDVRTQERLKNLAKPVSLFGDTVADNAVAPEPQTFFSTSLIDNILQTAATENAKIAGQTNVASPAFEFATIEIAPENVEPHLIAIRHPRSPHCEEYRSLRTQILHEAERRRENGKIMQAIVVASARPGEGKTTTAANLAWLLAQTDGVSCLLIDSDLRMPSLADYLGVNEKPGLSDVFDGTVELEQAIVRLNPAGLHLLPGGAARDDVAELLSGNAFRRVLNRARQMFDYIIIDAPPLGIFTDAAVLINHSDGAMLVVKANKTHYSAVNRLLENLPRDRMLGVVLNGSCDDLAETHYSYYYDYAENKKRTSKNGSAANS